MSEGQHIVKAYEQELRQLRSLMSEMGGLVEQQVALATQAVVTQDANLAARAVAQDPAVDAIKALDSCRRALELAPDHPLALAVKGYALCQMLGDASTTSQHAKSV